VSYIEISKSNLLHNIETIANRCGKQKLAAVLKDNAYGHGLRLCAEICAEAGIVHAIVRDNDEADVICELFDSVLVLADATTPRNKNIHIAINRLGDIEALPSETAVHLKIDTGMHRNGVEYDELHIALERIASKKLNLAGVFSHLKSADELSSEYFWQEKRFEDVRHAVVAFCVKNAMPMPKFHLHNSSGILRKSSFEDYDMVRAGIALYGYLDMPSSFESSKLKPVMKLYAEKISGKNAKSGFRPGYGGAYELSDDMPISIYDVGYSDGFMRLNERKRYNCACGSPVGAKVSMDNIIIASDKDRVCLFDDARELAKLNDTITYDILVKLSQKIKRVVV